METDLTEMNKTQLISQIIITKESENNYIKKSLNLTNELIAAQESINKYDKLLKEALRLNNVLLKMVDDLPRTYYQTINLN